MGTSSSKVPQYEVVDHQQQQASTSDTPRPSTGSFSPPSQGLLQPPSPSLQQWAPVQQAPPPPLPQGWDFHIDPATGFPYFYNTRTGVSQWQDPRGPGFALPDRSDATNLGQRRQVIPPWEGGPAGADPLSWPLPPGWQEQQDQATNQRYYVNYDARIVSYNDPRLEIAKAYSQGPIVEGVPVHYPPPVIGRPVDEQSKPFEYDPLGPPPPAWSSGQGGTSYLPPPPPLKKRKYSLWSKLGYRHGRQGQAMYPGGGGLYPGLYLFGNPAVPGVDGGGDSSSSSSSSDSDDENDGGDDFEGGDAGDFSLGPANDPFGGGVDLGGDSEGGDSEGGDIQGAGRDSAALDEYGKLPRKFIGGITDVSLGNMADHSNVSGAYQQSLLGFWQSQARDVYFQGWDDGLKSTFKGGKFSMMDRYTKIVIVLTVLVGSYFGVVEGLLSFLISFAGRLIVLTCKRTKMVKGQQKRSGHRLSDTVRLVFKKKGLTLLQLKTTAVSQFTQIQAWFYEHLYDHPLVRVRMLTEKDEASPLYSRLHSRPREITIVTQASADRLPAIEAMAKSWGGVMCVAIHVRKQAELQHVYPRLCNLHERIEAQGLCRLHVCVAKEEGLLTDEEAAAALYPINAMRNIALSMATTELVLILDADFVPSVGMHEVLTDDEAAYSEIRRMATAERQMLVIPAFEGISGNVEDSDILQITYPTQMCELREHWKEGSAKAFHCSHFPRGHKPTNYDYFFNPSTLKPYRVQYREFYEPYAICAREVIPPFDARFSHQNVGDDILLHLRGEAIVNPGLLAQQLHPPYLHVDSPEYPERGYGLNKISHAYHCAAMGMGFSVLPQVFVWSLPHCKSQAWVYTFGRSKDPLQKLRILGLYRRFKSEVQLLHRLGKKTTRESFPGLLEIKVEMKEPFLPPHVNMHMVA